MKKETAKYKISPSGKRKLLFPNKAKSCDKVKLPLIGKTIYLDVKEVKHLKRLQNDLGRLGATLEEFLSKDINYLITTQPRPRHRKDNNCGELSPAPSPFNCDPSPSPSNPDEKRIPTTTRGKALAERARILARGTNTLLDNAEKWGVKIVTLESAYKWIEKELKKLPKSQNSAKKTPKSKCIAKYKTFKSPFLKVEISNYRYRPLNHQLEVWPRLNVDTPRGSCPFDGTQINRGDQSNEERGVLAAQVDIPSVDTPNEEKDGMDSNTPKPSADKSTAKKSESDIFGGSRILTAGELRRRIELKRKLERKRGYCECCLVKYEDLDKHVRDDAHRAYVRDKSHYQKLDNMINTGPDSVCFLQKCLTQAVFQQRRTAANKTRVSEGDEIVLIPITPSKDDKKVASRLCSPRRAPASPKPKTATPILVPGSPRMTSPNARLSRSIARNEIIDETTVYRKSPRKAKLTEDRDDGSDAVKGFAEQSAKTMSVTNKQESPRNSPRKSSRQLYDKSPEIQLVHKSKRTNTDKNELNDSLSRKAVCKIINTDKASVQDNKISDKGTEELETVSSKISCIGSFDKDDEDTVKSDGKQTSEKVVVENELNGKSWRNVKHKSPGRTDDLGDKFTVKRKPLKKGINSLKCLSSTENIELNDFDNLEDKLTSRQLRKSDIKEKQLANKNEAVVNSVDQVCGNEPTKRTGLRSPVKVLKGKTLIISPRHKPSSSPSKNAIKYKSCYNFEVNDNDETLKQNVSEKSEFIRKSPRKLKACPLVISNKFDSINNYPEDEKCNKSKPETSNKTVKDSVDERETTESSLEGNNAREVIDTLVKLSKSRADMRHSSDDFEACVSSFIGNAELPIKETKKFDNGAAVDKESSRLEHSNRNSLTKSMKQNVEVNGKSKTTAVKTLGHLNCESSSGSTQRNKLQNKTGNSLRQSRTKKLFIRDKTVLLETPKENSSKNDKPSSLGINSDILSDFLCYGDNGDIMTFSKTLAERIKERSVGRRSSIESYNINILGQSMQRSRSNSLSSSNTEKKHVKDSNLKEMSKLVSDKSKKFTKNKRSGASIASNRVRNKYKSRRLASIQVDSSVGGYQGDDETDSKVVDKKQCRSGSRSVKRKSNQFWHFVPEPEDSKAQSNENNNDLHKELRCLRDSWNNANDFLDLESKRRLRNQNVKPKCKQQPLLGEEKKGENNATAHVSGYAGVESDKGSASRNSCNTKSFKKECNTVKQLPKQLQILQDSWNNCSFESDPESNVRSKRKVRLVNEKDEATENDNKNVAKCKYFVSTSKCVNARKTSVRCFEDENNIESDNEEKHENTDSGTAKEKQTRNHNWEYVLVSSPKEKAKVDKSLPRILQQLQQDQLNFSGNLSTETGTRRRSHSNCYTEESEDVTESDTKRKSRINNQKNQSETEHVEHESSADDDEQKESTSSKTILPKQKRTKCKFWQFVEIQSPTKDRNVDKSMPKELQQLQDTWQSYSDISNFETRTSKKRVSYHENQTLSEKSKHAVKYITRKRDCNKNKSEDERSEEELENTDLLETCIRDSEQDNENENSDTSKKGKWKKKQFWDYVAVKSPKEKAKVDKSLPRFLQQLQQDQLNFSGNLATETGTRRKSHSNCYKEESVDVTESDTKRKSKNSNQKNQSNPEHVEHESSSDGDEEEESASSKALPKQKRTKREFWQFVEIQSPIKDKKVDKSVPKELQLLQDTWQSYSDVSNCESRTSKKRVSYHENQTADHLETCIRDSEQDNGNENSDESKRGKWKNKQLWKYVVVKSPKEKAKVDKSLPRLIQKLQQDQLNFFSGSLATETCTRRKSRSKCYTEECDDVTHSDRERKSQIKIRKTHSESEHVESDRHEKNLNLEKCVGNSEQESENENTDISSTGKRKHKHWEYVVDESPKENMTIDKSLPRELQKLQQDQLHFFASPCTETSRRGQGINETRRKNCVNYRENHSESGNIETAETDGTSDSLTSDSEEYELSDSCLSTSDAESDNADCEMLNTKKVNSHKEKIQKDKSLSKSRPRGNNVVKNNGNQLDDLNKSRTRRKPCVNYQETKSEDDLENESDTNESDMDEENTGSKKKNLRRELQKLHDSWNIISLDSTTETQPKRDNVKAVKETEIVERNRKNVGDRCKLNTGICRSTVEVESAKSDGKNEKHSKKLSRGIDSKTKLKDTSAVVSKPAECCINSTFRESNCSDSEGPTGEKTIEFHAKSNRKDESKKLVVNRVKHINGKNESKLKTGHKADTDTEGKNQQKPSMEVSHSDSELPVEKSSKRKRFWDYVVEYVPKGNEKVDNTLPSQLKILQSSWNNLLENTELETSTRRSRPRNSSVDKSKTNKTCVEEINFKSIEVEERVIIASHVGGHSDKADQLKVTVTNGKKDIYHCGRSPIKTKNINRKNYQKGSLSPNRKRKFEVDNVNGEHSRSQSPTFQRSLVPEQDDFVRGDLRSTSPVFQKSPLSKKRKEMKLGVNAEDCVSRNAQNSAQKSDRNDLEKNINKSDDKKKKVKILRTIGERNRGDSEVNVSPVNTPNKTTVPDTHRSGYSGTPREQRRKQWKRKKRDTDHEMDSNSGGSSGNKKKQRRLEKLKYKIDDVENKNSSNMNHPRLKVSQSLEHSFDANDLQSSWVKNKRLTNDEKNNENATSNFSLKWEPLKVIATNEDKHTVKLNKSWSLLSDKSVSKLLSSEDDRESFHGFDNDDLTKENTLPSDLSYEEHSEVELEHDPEHEWFMNDQDEIEDKEGTCIEKAEFENFLPGTFSSPGKRSDSSWGDACEDYIDKSLKQGPTTPLKALSSSIYQSLTSPWKSPRRRFCDKNTSGAEEGFTPKTNKIVTPRKLTRSASPTFDTDLDVEKVDKEIEFNFNSPQKQRRDFSPLRVQNGRIVEGQGNCRPKTMTSTPTAERRDSKKKSVNRYDGLVFSSCDEDFGSDSDFTGTKQFKLLKKVSNIKKKFTLEYKVSPEKKKKTKSKKLI